MSLDGGGYLGLASASFLDAIERHFGATCHDRFDLFCGTSTGAIIALALASGRTASEVVELYERIGPAVFPPAGRVRRAGRFLKGFFVSRYRNDGLRDALVDVFGSETLGDLRARDKKVLVTAYGVTNGRPRVFKTDHADVLSTDDGYQLADIALASAAAPIHLPVVQIKSPTDGNVERFADGGLFANHPALLGFAEAVADLGEPPEGVEILSVSTPRVDLAEHESNTPWLKRFLLRRGVIGWLVAPSLVEAAIDSSSKIAHHTLERIAGATGAFYERVDLRRPRGLELDMTDERVTNTLRRLGSRAASQGATRRILQRFFN